MKVNKATQELLVENLTSWLDSLCDGMRHYITKINEAETVEDIMRYKKEMLIDYLDNMPIGICDCYFCLLYQDDCKGCKYGKIHGFCNDDGSDYEEIHRLRNKLRTAVEERYYRGETYGDC